jgi:hypothetical protein
VKLYQKVNVYEVNYGCDKCGEIMKFNGMSLMSSPPQYPHTCPECGYSVNLEMTYPTIEYKPTEQEESQ